MSKRTLSIRVDGWQESISSVHDFDQESALESWSVIVSVLSFCTLLGDNRGGKNIEFGQLTRACFINSASG